MTLTLDYADSVRDRIGPRNIFRPNANILSSAKNLSR